MRGTFWGRWDHFHASGYVMIAVLQPEVYEQFIRAIGNWFSWLNIAAFLVLALADFHHSTPLPWTI